jgi:hypothetical protein
VVTGGRIEIRPESLQAAGSSLARTAGEMADAVTHLQAAVTSNNPWGGDETGTMFAGIYNLVLGHTLDALGSYVDQVGYAGAALVQQAQEVVDTDVAAAVRVDNSGAGL